WFSSWLWPFSTLGWPEKTEDLEYFYPTSTLVTAQEIIFFWVARMIMAGLEFVNEVPFHSVFIHGTVRVEGGHKMSKSLGNVIDPLEIIDEMGADALRFSLMMLAATDVYLSREKFEMGRNFTNKIWNATRFVLTNLEGFEKLEDIERSSKLSMIDKWILLEMDHTAEEINECLKNFRFNEAANAVYHFFWGSFCDWYLELVKAVLQGKESPERRSTIQSVLVYILEKSMRLLHPFMPFISEEIWHLLKERVESNIFNQETIMLAAWPKLAFKDQFDQESKQVQIFQGAVVGIRDLRTRLGLKPAEKLEGARIVMKSSEGADMLNNFLPQISHFCSIEKVTIGSKLVKGKGIASRVYSHMEIFISGLSDEMLKTEEERTKKKIEELKGVIHGIESRLSDARFVSNAPEEVIEKERARKEDFAKQLVAYKENLALFRQ
ncbi:MAG: class I tRNA ligase family protein, partial [Candidatus Omnitrophica bacterium]|nr:class I tRNA ligase family protein [Candidatus Omnitrophota bacterium]